MKSKFQFSLLAFLAFVLVVGTGIGVLKYAWQRPEIVVKTMTGTQGFQLWIPDDKRPEIANLATMIQQLDLPSLLEQKTSSHAEIAAAWKESVFKTHAMPFGVNMINVMLMIPRYAASDPSDQRTKDQAENLNKQLDATIQEILDAEIAKAPIKAE